jgi:subtilisin family serine protease
MNYIIDFKNTVTTQDITDYLTNNSCTQLKTFNHFEKVLLVSSDSIPPTNDLVESVVQDSSNPVLPLEISQSFFDPEPQIYGTEDEQAWWKVLVQSQVDWNEPNQTLARQGKNIVVYVVDSGVNISHPEFAGVDCQNLFSFNNDFTDANGHGTAIASVIAGKNCGITNSSIRSVKIFHQGVDTLQSDMLSAFDAIIEDYISNDRPISIINLSWSIPKNSYIESKIAMLSNSGVAVICAAGNSGIPIQQVTPASMPGIITVGSFGPDLEPSNFSNYADESIISFTASETNSSTTASLFGWAPGEKIYVARKDSGYGLSAGTSIAAAVATATLAYNLGLEWTPDKGLPFALSANANPFYFHSAIFLRENILTLTDQYTNTKNRIATIKNKNFNPKYNQFLNESYFIVLYNRYTKIVVYDRLKYNTVSYSNLPPGLTIANGQLYGTIVSSTPEQPQQWTTQLTITGPNIESKTFTLTITALQSHNSRLTITGMSASAVDPTLDISLLDDNCCTWDGDSCEPPFPFICTQCCGDACGNPPLFAGCTGFDKNSCGCFCDCGSGITYEKCCG